MKSQAIFLSKGVAKIIEREIDKPKRNEVLIKTKACGICMGDINIFQGKSSGEGVMGHEGSGVVVEVGEEVKNIKVGEKVTALGGPAFAEFIKADYRNIARIPDKAEDFTSWISEPLACAVNGIKGSEIQIGDNICLIGCGYMGLLLLQVLPKNNINSLIALDIRDERLKLAEKFGAEHVLNPKECDEKNIHEIIGGEADIVIEASGAPGTIYFATNLLKAGGKLVIFGRHVIDEKVPTDKWHMKGLRILNTSPYFSANFNKDFHDAVKLLRRGVIDQKTLITHKFAYQDAEKAFVTASKKILGYIKGVITF